MTFKEFKAVFRKVGKPELVKTTSGLEVLVYTRYPGGDIKKIKYYFRKNRIIAILYFLKRECNYNVLIDDLTRMNGKPTERTEAGTAVMVKWELPNTRISLFRSTRGAMNMSVYGGVNEVISSNELFLLLRIK